VKSVIFKIEGMHCDGCADTLQALLKREPGVKSASVTFASREAKVLYDPTAVDEERLVAAAQRPGFQVVGRGS
jgi:copper chaperone CopZ